MVQLSSEALKAFVRKELKNWKNVIRRDSYTIYKEVDYNGLVLNIISFNDKTFVTHKVVCKIHYIEFGKYLIAVKETVIDNEVYLDFNTTIVYSAKNGDVVDDHHKIVPGNIKINNVVVLNHNILAVCSNTIPAFYAVVNGMLQELPALTVEYLLAFAWMTEKEQLSMVNFSPSRTWYPQNGLLLDEINLSTISELDYLCWKSHKRKIYPAFRKFSSTTLMKMLSIKNCNQPVIRYIQTNK